MLHKMGLLGDRAQILNPVDNLGGGVGRRFFGSRVPRQHRQGLLPLSENLRFHVIALWHHCQNANRAEKAEGEQDCGQELPSPDRPQGVGEQLSQPFWLHRREVIFPDLHPNRLRPT